MEFVVVCIKLKKHRNENHTKSERIQKPIVDNTKVKETNNLEKKVPAFKNW